MNPNLVESFCGARRYLPVVAFVALAACGGGGGNEPTAATNSPSTTGTPTSGTPTTGTPTTGTPSPAQPPAPFFTEVTFDNAKYYASDSLRDIKRGLTAGPSVFSTFNSTNRTIFTGSFSGQCSNGVPSSGTATGTVVDVNNNNGMDVNDGVSLSYDNCLFAASGASPAETYDGSLITDVLSLSARPSDTQSWSGTLKQHYLSLATWTADALVVLKTDGFVQREAIFDAGNNTRGATVSYDNFVAGKYARPGYTPGADQQFEYRYTDTVVTYFSDSTGTRTGISGSYKYTSPARDQSFPTNWLYTTTTPLRLDVSGNPMEGEYKFVTSGTVNGGLAATTWQVTIVDANTVRVGADLNNDGTIDTTYDFTWAEVQ
jgi:hypothetical protein